MAKQSHTPSDPRGGKPGTGLKSFAKDGKARYVQRALKGNAALMASLSSAMTPERLAAGRKSVAKSAIAAWERKLEDVNYGLVTQAKALDDPAMVVFCFEEFTGRWTGFEVEAEDDTDTYAIRWGFNHDRTSWNEVSGASAEMVELAYAANLAWRMGR